MNFRRSRVKLNIHYYYMIFTVVCHAIDGPPKLRSYTSTTIFAVGCPPGPCTSVAYYRSLIVGNYSTNVMSHYDIAGDNKL